MRFGLAGGARLPLTSTVSASLTFGDEVDLQVVYSCDLKEMLADRGTLGSWELPELSHIIEANVSSTASK